MEKMVFENYTKILKGKTVLSDISVCFNKGSVYKICGENGSGKTMLLRAAAGLIYPTNGVLKIDGIPVIKGKEYPASRGVVIETPAFWEDYTGIDFLSYLASINGSVGKDEIRNAMKRMNLDPDDDRRIKKYSLGMKQKLGIVQAIMEKQDILLLDEPLNALDIESIHAFETVIYEEKERGALIILALHNEGEFKMEYDGIFKMEEGRIYEQ